MRRKTVHIAGQSTFIGPFISFVEKHFDCKDHQFFLIGGTSLTESKPTENVNSGRATKSSGVQDYFRLIVPMHQSHQIILHGLFNWRIVVLLFLMPWLLKKCYWVIWGGDLYVYRETNRDWKWRVKEFIRRPVIKSIGYLVTYIPGDLQLARQWYGAKGKHHECLMYKSNAFREVSLPRKQSKDTNILVGNSADPSNSHAAVFERLLEYKCEEIRILCPLSYGEASYARCIAELGKELFGEKFEPLLEFMPLDQYLVFLGQVDIVMFAHDRQQAMGNTINLLGLGKTVYMRSDTTQWAMLRDMGIKLFDLEAFDLSRLSKAERTTNKNRIRENFSESKLVEQWSEIFG